MPNIKRLLLLIPTVWSLTSLADIPFDLSTLSKWQKESFSGFTNYQVVMLDGEQVLQAKTKNSASALYQEKQIDLKKTPYLNWSWRVENTLSIDNPLVKSGDDYPARVYVVVKEGFLPWQTKALNYVWCNQSIDKDFWPNPFTSKAVMIPVHCGDEDLGQWRTERINVREDFRRIFNKSIDSVDGIAIMSDSDNSGGSATAYYKELYFSD